VLTPMNERSGWCQSWHNLGSVFRDELDDGSWAWHRSINRRFRGELNEKEAQKKRLPGINEEEDTKFPAAQLLSVDGKFFFKKKGELQEA
jgi:hypothetical protein